MENKVFVSALSKKKDWNAAVEELSETVKKGLQGKSCDLLIFFVSEPYENLEPVSFVRAMSDALPSGTMIGCNSSGVISNDREVEMQPALSALAMHLPDVRIYPFSASGPETASIQNGNDLINFFDIYPTDKPRFICLADPSGCDIVKFLQTFNDAYKGLPVVGGLASGLVAGAPNWLCLNKGVYSEGVVGLALVGDIEFETIVSQGCRPIGKPFVITKAEENVLYELSGRPTLTVLREILEELPPQDRKLAEESLSVGLVMNEKQTQFRRGDFLIRNLLRFDPESGALWIGAFLKVGQTLQFQVRDAETSDEDLRLMLGKMTPKDGAAHGAFLVSCCGRGQNLYGKPDHDARLIQSARGPLPLAGFFANGEIGPVGQKNFVHGFTSSLVVFR